MKVAFLDRDGTFLWEPEKPAGIDPRETFPLKSMQEFKFMNGALAGLKQLDKKDYRLVMVTNQTFLGTSKHPQQMFDQVMARIDEVLAKENLAFIFKMVCPHGPDDGCNCRKPNIGGLDVFLQEYDVDLSQSLMFGDRATDEEFAHNLGVSFVGINTNERFNVPHDL